jgi:hypothetical protein
MNEELVSIQLLHLHHYNVFDNMYFSIIASCHHIIMLSMLLRYYTMCHKKRRRKADFTHLTTFATTMVSHDELHSYNTLLCVKRRKVFFAFYSKDIF